MQVPELASRIVVHDLVRSAIDDIRGFAVEKHGIGPDIELDDLTDGLEVLCMPEYVRYALTEVLKNAVQALVDKHGAWDVDEAPPIRVTVQRGLARSAANGGELDGGTDAARIACASDDVGRACDTSASQQQARNQPGSDSDKYWTVAVTDRGGGLSADTLQSMQRFFSSTTEKREATYGYSKAHGAQFSGQGVGVPMTALYVEFMGGKAEWRSPSNDGGVVVTLTLPVEGFAFQQAL